MQYEPPAINFQSDKNSQGTTRGRGAWSPGPRRALALAHAWLGHDAVGASAHQTGQSAARQATGATLLVMAGMRGMRRSSRALRTTMRSVSNRGADDCPRIRIQIPAASSQRYRLPSLSDRGALVRLAAIGASVLAIAVCFAFVGGWLSPGRLGEARFIDRFEQVNGGAHPGFRRNHAKGVCIAGGFDSNGQGVRLSKAAVFAPAACPSPAASRSPVATRMSRTDRRPYCAMALRSAAARRPGVANGDDRHSGFPGQKRRGPLRAAARDAARSGDRSARPGEDGGLHRRASRIPRRPCNWSRARRRRPASPTPPSTASMHSVSSTRQAR